MSYRAPERLVGRDAELQIVASVFDGWTTSNANSVTERALLVLAEAGVGKTALLNTAADAAASSGALILRAEGVEFEADVSFSGLNQALLPLLKDFSRLDRLHRDALSSVLGLASGPVPDRLVVSNAVLSLLQHAAEDRPVLVVIDDVPWLDRSSADILGFVARRLTGGRVGLLAASRPGPGNIFDGLPLLHLDPLSPDAANDLLRMRFPMLAAGARRRMLDEAQGNPLALLELPAALSGRQRIATQSLPPVLALGERLQAVFETRVSGLTDAARELLLLAVLEGARTLDVLQHATGDSDLGGLDCAESAGLVRIGENPQQLVFRHPLARSAIVGVSTRGQRRRAHQRLAEVLSDHPERRAWHLAEAATGPDEEVAALLEQSARRILGRGDPVLAVQRLSRAAELSPGPADRSRRLTEAAFVSANLAGGLDDVSRLLVEATQAGAGRQQMLQAATTAAFLLLMTDGDVDTAVRLLQTAIDSCGTSLDATDDSLVAAIYLLSLMCGFGRRAELYDGLFRVLDRMVPEAPDDLYLLSRIVPDPVRTAAAVLPQLEAALAELTDEAPSWRFRKLAMAAAFTDRLSEHRPLFWRFVEEARSRGAVTVVVALLLHICLDDIHSGRWDELDELTNECLLLCETRGLGLYVPVFQHRRAMLAAARGDENAVKELAQVMTRWAVPRRAEVILDYAHHALALCAIGRLDFEDAYRHAIAVSPPGTLPPYCHEAPGLCLDLVEAAVRTGRRAEAEAHVSAIFAADIAGLSNRLSLLAHGAAALAAEEDASAICLFEQAVGLPGADRWPFELARVQLAFGERLRRVHAAERARGQLATALATFEKLRALPWIDRAANELRATGRARSACGAEALTPQEQEIAALAAEGLTNKQIGERLFLSHRTVSTHLYRIFPKLGIATRGALRDALLGSDDT
ncbi:ATP-binding protein [Kribbella sp. NPDC058693]|uniref:ATP-binding protein n=1 Tax=Kribbella sp. NPDC058693 TaxID=3346602 RepID=UPI0036674B6D